MSTVSLPKTDPVDELTPRRRTLRTQQLSWTTVFTAIGFAVIAAVLRLIHIATSYDLFIDETTYASIAGDSNLATGPMLHGLPFVLHPPLALLLLAGPAEIVGTTDVAALIADLRPFVALVGALTVAVLYLTLRQAGLRKAALLAAALVALDPFIISFDSRVMLEAFAQLFAILTIAAALRAATATSRTRGRWYTLTALAGALTFGTKETFGLVILATLVLIAFTAPRDHRRPTLLAVAGTLVGYALINTAMITWSSFPTWWHMRTDGLSRLLGINQTTGFKAEDADTSFWERVLPQGTEIGATYAILALGGLCALFLLWSLHRHRPSTTTAPLPLPALAAERIIAIWAVCACSYVAYAVVFGSLEEQMFYIAAAPCAAALAICVFRIGKPAWRRGAVAGMSVILLLQGATWVRVHMTPDDVYAQLLAQIPDAAPAGSTIAVTEETGQFVLSGYDLGQWATVPDLQANGAEYVLLSDRLVEHGYGLADQEFADQVREHGSLLLSVEGRRNDLQLYDVRSWTGAAGNDGVTTGEGS